jgi:hypothetical protein
MPVPDFSPGEVLTAAAMDSIGLWLVKTQTVGAGVSSVVVTGAFSATYDNYLVTYNGGTSSSSGIIGLRLGATATGYRCSYIFTSWNNTVGASGSSTDTTFTRFGRHAGSSASTGYGMLLSPFLSSPTRFIGSDISTTDGGNFVGYMDNSTSYTEFTLLPNTGTLTGGTIRVYGYRN